MSDNLVIRKLAVKDIPGFPNQHLRPMEFCEGVNIVYGPNASGKTTTARAIQMLLWPQSGIRDAYITAEISLGDAAGSFIYSGGSRRDDPSLPLPYIGEPSCRNRYMLAQHELLAADEKGADLAAIILGEARGGLDVDRAKRELGYAQKGQLRRPADLMEAQRRHTMAKDAENDIRVAEVRLESIEADIERAGQAKVELERLQLAVDYRRDLMTVEGLKEELKSFPAEMEHLRGDELQRLDDLNRSIGDIEGRIKEAEREMEEAAAALAATRIGDTEKAAGAARSARALSERIDGIDKSLADARNLFKQAESEAGRAYTSLGGRDISGYANPLEVSVVERLESFVRRAEDLGRKQESLNEQLRWLVSIAPARDDAGRNVLQQAAADLYRWLYAGTGKETRSGFAGIIAAGCLLLLVCLAASVVQRSLLGGITAAFGIVLLLILLRLSASVRQNGGLTRREIEERFASFGPEGPKEWSESQVEAAALGLLERISVADMAGKADEKRYEARLKIDELEGQRQELDSEREAVSALLGMDPDKACKGGNSLFFFVTQLSEWQHKSASADRYRNEIKCLEEDLKVAISKAAEVLRDFVFKPIEGNEELREAIRSLEERINGLRDAETRLGSVKKVRENLELQRSGLLEERYKLLSPFGLEERPDAADMRLKELLAGLKSFDDIKINLSDTEAVCREKSGRGSLWPDWERIISLDPAELQARYDQKEQQSAELNDLNTEKGRLTEQVRAAKEASSCEEALARLDKAESDFRKKVVDSLRSAIGWRILDAAGEYMENAELPDVFARAAKFFAEFSRGRYELRFSPNKMEFKAYDNIDQEERGLDQLSSATRVQLLMAVRLAFVEERETGVKIPLLMDETLAGSDAVRERAIIETAMNICRSGRQVFYFTSKQSEKNRWLALAEESGIAVRVIDLAETPPDEVAPMIEDVALPEPGNTTHAQYGQALGIPQLDLLSSGAADAHIWYILADNARLKTLLENGILRCGQLCSRQMEGIIDGLIGREEADKARALAEVLRDVELLRRRGRGKRLDYTAIAEAGIFSGTFLPEVAGLADRLNGDAGDILDRMENKEIKRLQRDKIDAFRDYCAENGYLPGESQLTDEEVRQHALEKAAGSIESKLISAADVAALCRRVI